MGNPMFSHDAFVRDVRTFCNHSSSLEKLGLIKLLLNDVIGDYRLIDEQCKDAVVKEKCCTWLRFFDTINDEINRLHSIDLHKFSTLLGVRRH